MWENFVKVYTCNLLVNLNNTEWVGVVKFTTWLQVVVCKFLTCTSCYIVHSVYLKVCRVRYSLSPYVLLVAWKTNLALSMRHWFPRINERHKGTKPSVQCTCSSNSPNILFSAGTPYTQHYEYWHTLSLILGSAPASSNRLTISTCPLSEAKRRAVSPVCEDVMKQRPLEEQSHNSVYWNFICIILQWYVRNTEYLGAILHLYLHLP